MTVITMKIIFIISHLSYLHKMYYVYRYNSDYKKMYVTVIVTIYLDKCN